jgi:capsule polysaccharide modification protein KpsS
MHGNGHGFQQVGYRLAKTLGLKTVITENGYFRPLSLTVEYDGVNASSVMKQWHADWNNSESEQQSFDEFMRFRGDYRDRGIYRGSALGRVSKELKQRFVYADCEGYDHNWITRIRKFAWNQKHLKDGTERLPHGDYICFFVSSVYDPQLSIPSSQHINKIVIQVLGAFEAFSTNYPQVRLVIKEHPLDQTRVLLDYHSNLSFYKDVAITNANTDWLIQNAKGILTINSTVGIDALLEKKSLLCLGNALYNHRDLCLQIEGEVTEEKIVRALHQLMEFKPNERMINSYLNSLFIKTQVAAERDQDVQETIAKKFFNRFAANVQ